MKVVVGEKVVREETAKRKWETLTNRSISGFHPFVNISLCLVKFENIQSFVTIVILIISMEPRIFVLH
jgi:hypothetical protein